MPNLNSDDAARKGKGWRHLFHNLPDLEGLHLGRVQLFGGSHHRSVSDHGPLLGSVVLGPMRRDESHRSGIVGTRTCGSWVGSGRIHGGSAGWVASGMRGRVQNHGGRPRWWGVSRGWTRRCGALPHRWHGLCSKSPPRIFALRVGGCRRSCAWRNCTSRWIWRSSSSLSWCSCCSWRRRPPWGLRLFVVCLLQIVQVRSEDGFLSIDVFLSFCHHRLFRSMFPPTASTSIATLLFTPLCTNGRHRLIQGSSGSCWIVAGVIAILLHVWSCETSCTEGFSPSVTDGAHEECLSLSLLGRTL
mmetsp:Transcript_68072/g.148440  ORF Transcript_68072/g.148440 Transcript_68072/m.148440 type:complete len:301 (+) Transcript_68072:1278-2180(+)